MNNNTNETQFDLDLDIKYEDEDLPLRPPPLIRQKAHRNIESAIFDHLDSIESRLAKLEFSIRALEYEIEQLSKKYRQ